MATKSQSAKSEKVEKKASFVENYGSTVLGFVVVLILGSFLFNVFRGNKDGQVGSGEEAKQDEQTQETNTPGGTHTVVKGEDLWKISEKYYGTGYNWTDIAKANNIAESDAIVEGQKLTIPVVTPIKPTEVIAPTVIAQVSQTPTQTPTATSTPTAVPTKVEPTKAQTTTQPTTKPTIQPTTQPAGQSGSYTVQKGDTLWNIAIKEYNDGYKWVDIARANKLVHPDIIHSGNKLILPR